MQSGPTEGSVPRALDRAVNKITAPAPIDGAQRRVPQQPNLMIDAAKLMGKGGVDPSKLAESYGKPDTSLIGESRSYQVLAFVSLSMPEGSLVRLGRDAKRIGAAVVLRGMRHGLEPGTWVRSVEALKPLVDTGADIQINPGLFEQFGVRSVPAVILSPGGIADKGCVDESCSAGPVGVVLGDVTLEYALDSMAERKDAVGALARRLLQAF